MKIVVTGSLGNIGRPLVEELVQQGHSVTAISRNAGSRAKIENMGAIAGIGSVKDTSFLKEVFKEADTAFCMIPPDYTVPDQVKYYEDIAKSYAEAIPGSGIRKIVHLSSWGANLNKGTGFILGSHHAEKILNDIPNISITHLRAGFIYYNLFGFTDMIKQRGIMASVYGGNDKIVMVAPVDIAAAAAEELILIDNGKVRYIAGDDRTADEVAMVLGKSIGRPDLRWQILTGDEMKREMEQNGVPEYITKNAVALGESIHNGNLRKDYDKTGAYPTGKIKIEEFAEEFASVYIKS